MLRSRAFPGLGRRRGAERFASFAAERVIDAVPGDAAEPGLQLVPLAEVAEMFPGGDEGFLREVLARPQTPGGAVGERTDERLIARNDLPEGIAIAQQARIDQVRVRWRGERHCLGCHHNVLEWSKHAGR